MVEIDSLEGLTREEMQEQYEVMGFAYGFLVARRKSDGVEGTMSFKNVDGVRYYYDFVG